MLNWDQVNDALIIAADIEGREFTEDQVETWRDVIATRVDKVDEGELVEAVRAFYADPDQRGRLYPRDIVRYIEQSRSMTLWDIAGEENERLANERAAWEEVHGHSADLPCKSACPPRDPAELGLQDAAR